MIPLLAKEAIKKLNKFQELLLLAQKLCQTITEFSDREEIVITLLMSRILQEIRGNILKMMSLDEALILDVRNHLINPLHKSTTLNKLSND